MQVLRCDSLTYFWLQPRLVGIPGDLDTTARFQEERLVSALLLQAPRPHKEAVVSRTNPRCTPLIGFD